MNNDVEISPYGSLLIYKKGYSAGFVEDTISKLNLNGLRIFDHLDRLNSLDFLRNYGFLTQLSIDSIEEHNYNFLESLNNLQYLSIGITKTEQNIIDLKNLTNLETLAIKWRKNKIIGLENCQKISSLCLVDYREDNFLPISKLNRLKKLEVKTASVKTAVGLENMKLLEYLSFGYCRSLQSISAINGNKNLYELNIEACTKITDYQVLNGLPNLKTLKLINYKDIKSIDFIKNFPLLEQLMILGNTNVVDGNIVPAKDINKVFYGHRKHYNIKIENKEIEALRKRNLAKIKSLLNTKD